MAIAEQPHMALVGETVLQDPEFEALLEKRAAAAERRGKATKAFREIDVQAKARIAQVAPEGVLRVGRWVIETQERPGGHVEFDTAPAKRIVIKDSEAKR